MTAPLEMKVTEHSELVRRDILVSVHAAGVLWHEVSLSRADHRDRR